MQASRNVEKNPIMAVLLSHDKKWKNIYRVIRNHHGESGDNKSFVCGSGSNLYQDINVPIYI